MEKFGSVCGGGGRVEGYRGLLGVLLVLFLEHHCPSLPETLGLNRCIPSWNLREARAL